jgi:serine/threonine-protein kinase
MRTCEQCKSEYPDDVTICPKDGSPVRVKKEAPPPPDDPLLGRMVGSYRLIKPLGKGGMGAVYMGEHPAIGSKVAVKFLHAQYAKVHEVVTRFFNEAKAVNLIKHDNIVQVIDYMYLDDEMPCFVMEYLEKGYPMSKLVGKPQPLQITGPIFLQLCDALGAAHDKQIIHRDLKPDNVFLAVRNYRKHFVKVMDFGIAKLAATGTAEDSNTQMGEVLGTPSYMSPEQGMGKVDLIGPRSDIYSLGIIMYQLAAGRVPFKGGMVEVLQAHVYNEPASPRLTVPEIPEGYEAIILKCIAKKPDDRFQSMRELGQAIHELMHSLGMSTELPPEDDVIGAPSNYVPAPSMVPTSGGRPANVATVGPAGSTAAGRRVNEVLPPSDAEANQATLLKPATNPGAAASPATPAPRPATLAVAAPAAVVPEAVAAPSSSMRLVVAAVAFGLGLAVPIALVKGGVVGPKAHAAKR